MGVKGILFMATTDFGQLVEGGKPMLGSIQVVDDVTGRSYGTQSVFVSDPQVYAQVRQFVEALLPQFSQEAGMPCELAQPITPPLLSGVPTALTGEAPTAVTPTEPRAPEPVSPGPVDPATPES